MAKEINFKETLGTDWRNAKNCTYKREMVRELAAEAKNGVEIVAYKYGYSVSVKIKKSQITKKRINGTSVIAKEFGGINPYWIWCNVISAKEF